MHAPLKKSYIYIPYILITLSYHKKIKLTFTLNRKYLHSDIMSNFDKKLELILLINRLIIFTRNYIY